MATDSDTLYDLLYYCQKGQRVAIVGSRTDDDPVRNDLYVEQPQDSIVQSSLDASHDDGKMLVITGSAGDGKSALLERGTRLAEHDVIPDSRVNMDATSARAGDEDYDSRLVEFFERVLPAVQSGSGQRSALAINYGLAIDFFRLRGHQSEYPDVWAAIQQSESSPEPIDQDNIKVINLSHRQAYKSHPNHIGDGLLLDLVERFDPTKPESPFSEAFDREKQYCPAGQRCPLRYNLKQLTDDAVKEQLAETLASWSIITGSYLNPRTIIDKLSSIILPPDLQNFPESKYCPVGAAIDSPDVEFELEPEHLLWNAVFNELNSGDDKLANRIDPVSHTDFKTDRQILTWSADETSLEKELSDLPVQLPSTRDQIRTVLRRQWLTNTTDKLITEEGGFRQFLAALTYFKASGSDSSVEDLEKIVQTFLQTIKKALDNWTGRRSEGEYVEFRDARRSSEYRFLSTWNQPKILLDRSSEATRRVSTPGRIRLFIEAADEEAEPIQIPLSFDLFRLMNMVRQGYTPNATDLNRSHAIQMMQSRMGDLTDKRDFVQIKDRTGSRTVELTRGELGITVSSEGLE